jgi:hypothetical protein
MAIKAMIRWKDIWPNVSFLRLFLSRTYRRLMIVILSIAICSEAIFLIIIFMPRDSIVGSDAFSMFSS